MIANTAAALEALKIWSARRRDIFYPKTDFEVDFAALRKRKRELFEADLSRLSSKLDEEVSGIEPLPGLGTFHALFRVIVSGRTMILKLALEEPAFDFAIESWATRRLREAGLPSLEISAFNIFRGSLPAPFLLMETAPGQALNRIENPETQQLPDPLLFELGRIFGRIHSIQGEGSGFLDVGALPGKITGLGSSWSDYIMVRLDEHLRVCLQTGAITGMELSRIEAQFAAHGELLDDAPIRLLHGDPGHHNVFSEGERITAIIDWEDALCGDPVFDVAFWGTFTRDELRARFLEGYAEAQTLPADFERRYWLYYLRVAISKTVHRHRFGALDRPGRPPAARRIQKALSNLEDL